MEFFNDVLSTIIEQEWASSLLIVAFCMVAVGIVSLIKLLVLTQYKRIKNKELDKKVLETPLTYAAFAIAFALIYSFNIVHMNMDLVSAIKPSSACAGLTSILYIVVAQAPKKVKKFCIKMYNKIKNKTITVEDVKNGIAELAKSTNSTALQEFIDATKD